MRVCIIIPAYNEEESICDVIRAIQKSCPSVDIVVVNDASLDRTSEVARRAGVPVIDLPINLGIGGAMQTGFHYAIDGGYDVAMQVDGDGQHDPVFIPDVLSVLERDEADMVIGSRYLEHTEYRASFMRLFGILMFSWLIDIVANKRIYDPTSGYRAYNKRALSFVASHYPSDFPEPESIVMMLRHGFRLKEVPVEMKQRQGGVSSVRPLKAVYFVASNSIAIVMSAFKVKHI